jgi:ribosomal protein S18 acetylase RimI-like enzyme
VHQIEIRNSVQDITEELVEVCGAAFGDDATGFRDDQLTRHPSRDDFRIALASVDGRIAGFVYGYTGRSGQWWTDRMREQVPAEVYAEWFDGHYEVVTLAVHPDHQRRGLGAALMRTLVGRATNDRALLSTAAGDSPARRLYQRLGWRAVAEVDDGRTVVLGLRLSPAATSDQVRSAAPAAPVTAAETEGTVR